MLSWHRAGATCRAGATTTRWRCSQRPTCANGRLWVELEGALPVELDRDQCVELTGAMADAVAGNRLPYAWGIHEGRPPAPGMPRNRHFPLDDLRTHQRRRRSRSRTLVPAREPAETCGRRCAKGPTLEGHQWVPNTRVTYERLLNEALERAGCPERVTCESHRSRMALAEAEGDQETAEYFLRHPPSFHIGTPASAIERGGPKRAGKPTERGDCARAREAQAANLRGKRPGR